MSHGSQKVTHCQPWRLAETEQSRPERSGGHRSANSGKDGRLSGPAVAQEKGHRHWLDVDTYFLPVCKLK